MGSAATFAPDDTFAAPAPDVSEEVLPDGLTAEAPAQGDGLATTTDELAEQIEALAEDDPRVAGLKAEWERRHQQGLADQKRALEAETRQAAANAAALVRIEQERRALDEAGIADTSRAMNELLELDPMEIPDRLKDLASNLRSGAKREAVDTLHGTLRSFTGAYRQQFVMPQQFEPLYREAAQRGDMHMAFGMALETARVLGIQDGIQQEQKRREQEVANGAEAGTRAATVAEGAAKRTAAPAPTPRAAATSPAPIKSFADAERAYAEKEIDTNEFRKQMQRFGQTY